MQVARSQQIALYGWNQPSHVFLRILKYILPTNLLSFHLHLLTASKQTIIPCLCQQILRPSHPSVSPPRQEPTFGGNPLRTMLSVRPPTRLRSPLMILRPLSAPNSPSSSRQPVNSANTIRLAYCCTSPRRECRTNGSKRASSSTTGSRI